MGGCDSVLTGPTSLGVHTLAAAAPAFPSPRWDCWNAWNAGGVFSGVVSSLGFVFPSFRVGCWCGSIALIKTRKGPEVSRVAVGCRVHVCPAEASPSAAGSDMDADAKVQSRVGPIFTFQELCLFLPIC